MKKNILQKNSYLAILVVVALSASLRVLAGSAWSEPSGAAVSVAVPVHSGDSQVKKAGLTVGAFIAGKDSVFNQQLFLSGAMKSDTGKLFFGGLDSGGATTSVDVVASADLKAAGTLQASNLVNTGTTDVCKNHAGVSSIPSGEYLDPDGNCYPIPVVSGLAPSFASDPKCGWHNIATVTLSMQSGAPLKSDAAFVVHSYGASFHEADLSCSQDVSSYTSDITLPGSAGDKSIKLTLYGTSKTSSLCIKSVTTSGPQIDLGKYACTGVVSGGFVPVTVSSAAGNPKLCSDASGTIIICP